MKASSGLYRTLRGAAVAALFVAPSLIGAQVPGAIPGGCIDSRGTRSGETGCYLLTTQPIERLPEGPLYWHLYSYPTRAAAESARAGPSSNVVEAFGRVWLFTIAGSQWRASAGDRIAAVGPLPIPHANQYVARYMEATFPPNRGLLTSVHRHSGPEAWYVLSGAQCLRTPEKTMVLRAGDSGVVPSGPPMVLTSIGTEIRRALLLVLHDASQPWMANTTEWTPTVECPSQ